MALNPTDSRPLYQQLAERLRAVIDRGDYPPGSRLPTEAELSQAHQASRNTVRLALGELKAAGLISAGKGRGTFVRERPPLRYHASVVGSRAKREATRLATFHQAMREQGREPYQHISVATIPAPADVAQALELAEGDPVLMRHRVMTADEIPVQLGTSYYPVHIAEGTPLAVPEPIMPGTDQVLEDLGYHVKRYFDEIRWRMPTPDEIRTLELGSGIPVVHMTRTYHTKEKPVHVIRNILPGDKHVLIYEVSAE